MSALSPVVSSFRSVRGHLPVVVIVTLSVAGLVLVNQLAGFVAMLVVTPMIIDLTVGKQVSMRAAFTQSKSRIVRYLCWRFAVTAAGLGVMVVALAGTGLMLFAQWSASGRIGGFTVLVVLAVLGASCVLVLAVGVVGDLLAVSVAAGHKSPWRSVGAVFAPTRRWPNVGSLGVVYGLVFATLAVNGLAFAAFMVKSQGSSLAAQAPVVAERLGDVSAGLPDVWVLWCLMAVMGVVTSFVSSVMRPVMLAEVLSSAAGPSPTVGRSSGLVPVPA